MSHIASFWKRKICFRIFRILAIFPQIHSLPFTDDLPSPLLSLFMKGPGRPEAQYYHQVFLSESINAEEIKSIDFFWISEIGCWFVRLLTMAAEAEWRVMFQISERDFLPTSQMDLEDHSTTLNYISKISKNIQISENIQISKYLNISQWFSFFWETQISRQELVENGSVFRIWAKRSYLLTNGCLQKGSDYAWKR